MEIIQIIASFILFGLTGSGKSSLGNTIIGRNVFEEGFGVGSQTMDIKKELGIFEEYQVYAIDTPGLLDSEGRDQQHLDKITQCIRENIGVKAIVVVIDFKNNKINNGVNKLFELIEQMYPNKPWYEHVVIVWSNYESGLSQQKKKTLSMKREGIKQTIKKIIPRITQEELNIIPQYFLDNIEARDPTTESHKKMEEMIKHISTLPPLNETLGIIQDVDNDVMKEEIETEEQVISDTVEGNIRIITTALFERKKKTLYSGKVLYSDWEEKSGSRKEERKQLEKPEPVSTIEYMDDMKVLGERKIVDRVVKVGKRRWYRHRGKKEQGRILQKRQYIRKQRTVTTDCDGNVTYSPWEIISSDTKEVEISRFGY